MPCLRQIKWHASKHVSVKVHAVYCKRGPLPPCLLIKASSQREVMIASCFTNMFAVFMMALADSQWMLFLGVLPRSRHPFRPISSPVACASNVS